MSNPNITAHYLPRPYPVSLTTGMRKYIIQGATPNDTRLDFNNDQRNLLAKGDLTTYSKVAYPFPNSIVGSPDVDIQFFDTISPNFDIWVEKVKVCIHAPTTYGCIKLNVWDFGTSPTNTPTNIVGINSDAPANLNVPLTIKSNVSLISNALDDTDLEMVASSQESIIPYFGHTISAGSYLRFGLQWAEGNAYGIKVFIIGWVVECDTV